MKKCLVVIAALASFAIWAEEAACPTVAECAEKAAKTCETACAEAKAACESAVSAACAEVKTACAEVKTACANGVSAGAPAAEAAPAAESAPAAKDFRARRHPGKAERPIQAHFSREVTDEEVNAFKASLMSKIDSSVEELRAGKVDGNELAFIFFANKRMGEMRRRMPRKRLESAPIEGAAPVAEPTPAP